MPGEKKEGSYQYVYYYSICVKGAGMTCLWGEESGEWRTQLFCFIPPTV